MGTNENTISKEQPKFVAPPPEEYDFTRLDTGEDNDYSKVYPELHQSIRRQSGTLLSGSNGETLRGFISRMRGEISLISQLHINVQGGYYSHTNPRGCYNCDAIVMVCNCLNWMESIAEQCDMNKAMGETPK